MACTHEGHDVMKKNPAVWATLLNPRLYTWSWGEVQEWRECARCGSTLVIVIKEGEAEDA